MKYKIINIESGMPTVEAGQKKLYFEIVTARRQGIKVIKVIHGYGSSGVGGRLKKGILEYLALKKREGFIKEYISGDDFDIFNQSTRNILEKYSELGKDNDLGRGNPGITMVLI